mgnify:CR=1 FL=1
MNLENLQKETGVSSSLMGNMSSMGHEQVVVCHDKGTGLKAIIAIHNTTLGPALGGTRMWNYNHERDAFKDVLRLSRGMTYKAAISGLELGGGKAVIIGDSKTQKTESLMRKFGQFVDTLKGRYITAEDVGMSPQDMQYVRMETQHVTGFPKSMGGSGDPSPVTAYGVYMGMKAAAKYKWGSDKLSSKTIVVQGIGHVGASLIEHLLKEGARVIANDINLNTLDSIQKKFDIEVAYGESIYNLDMDIYAPCALGSTVNPETIKLLKCDIIAGAANNQLADEDRDSNLLIQKGILYAPDFLINAGGLINVYSEIKGYSHEKAINKTKQIYQTTLDILNKAEQEDITSHVAALKIAQERIAAKKSSLFNVNS